MLPSKTDRLVVDGACRPHGLEGTANQTTKADKGISKKTLKAMGVRQEGRGPCKEKTLTGGERNADLTWAGARMGNHGGSMLLSACCVQKDWHTAEV